jgi:hypothetical protein
VQECVFEARHCQVLINQYHNLPHPHATHLLATADTLASYCNEHKPAPSPRVQCKQPQSPVTNTHICERCRLEASTGAQASPAARQPFTAHANAAAPPRRAHHTENIAKSGRVVIGCKGYPTCYIFQTCFLCYTSPFLRFFYPFVGVLQGVKPLTANLSQNRFFNRNSMMSVCDPTHQSGVGFCHIRTARALHNKKPNRILQRIGSKNTKRFKTHPAIQFQTKLLYNPTQPPDPGPPNLLYYLNSCTPCDMQASQRHPRPALGLPPLSVSGHVLPLENRCPHVRLLALAIKARGLSRLSRCFLFVFPLLLPERHERARRQRRAK